jgi:hypothetical protein
MGVAGLYRRARVTASDPAKCGFSPRVGAPTDKVHAQNYDNFIKLNHF